MNSENNKSNIWSRFWSTGAINSCGGSFDGNYGGSIAAWWQDVVMGIGPRHRVLDVCTGNGAIVRLISDRIPEDEKLPSITGVDLALIAPDWLKSLSAARCQKIKLIGNTSAEAMPLDDDSIDFICSQFGFEYCDADKTLQEFNRVAREQAVLALVLHHAGSVISRVSGEESRHCRFLLQANGLLHAARGLFPYLALIKNPQQIPAVFADPAADSIRIAYGVALELTKVRATASAVPDVLHETLSQVAGIGRLVQDVGAEQALAMLDKVGSNLSEAVGRLDDQVNHALSPDEAVLLQEKLRQYGFESRLSEIQEPGHGVLAWGLKATRNGKR